MSYHRHAFSLRFGDPVFAYCEVCQRVPITLKAKDPAMCTNEGKDEAPRAVGRHPGLDAPYGSGGIASNTANAVPPVTKGDPGYTDEHRSKQIASRGPKCLVAGCNNRFGEGVFMGELCAPCHRMLLSGYVQPQGGTFVHSMQRSLASAAEQSYMLQASKLLDDDCHKSGRWPSVVTREHTLRVIIAALKQGEQDAEEGKRESR